MSNMPEFCPGQSAASVHNSLKKSIETMDRAHHCAVLWYGEIMHRKLYRNLGYSTMRAYAMAELGFSSSRNGAFSHLADQLKNLPVVKEELASGRLGYSKALEILPVADKNNEGEWVALAKETPRAALRTEVKHARRLAAVQKNENPGQVELIPRPPAARPTVVVKIPVGFELSASQSAQYEAIMSKIGFRGSKAEMLLAMAEALLAETAHHQPETSRRRAMAAPSYQVHVHKCPDCAKVTTATPLGEVDLSTTEAEAACCDAEIHTPGQRNRTTIPPKTRREVLARDRYQCRRNGCGHTRFLQIHHVTPRAGGGTNNAENLVTLCSVCHNLWHERGGNLSMMLSAVRPESE